MQYQSFLVFFVITLLIKIKWWCVAIYKAEKFHFPYHVILFFLSRVGMSASKHGKWWNIFGKFQRMERRSSSCYPRCEKACENYWSIWKTTGKHKKSFLLSLIGKSFAKVQVLSTLLLCWSSKMSIFLNCP